MWRELGLREPEALVGHYDWFAQRRGVRSCEDMNGDRLLGPEYIAPWRKFPQFVRYREHDWQTGEPAAYMNELNEWGLGVGEAERVEFLRGLPTGQGDPQGLQTR